jgi:predicted nucleic acid-binding protein
VILLDTSGLLAALFADQNHHEQCARILRESKPPRVLSPFVLAELDYLILKYAGVEAELALLAEVGRGVYELAEFDRYDVDAAYEIVEQYRDLRIGLADASIAVCAKRWDARDVLTLDERHFRVLRAAPRKRFRILPADRR